MRYTPATFAKALVALATSTVGAATVAAGGADLAQLTPGQWAAALGAGLIAFGGVFVTPNKSTEPEPVPASPAEQVSTGMQQAIQNKADAESGVAAAEAELNRIKDAADSMLGAGLGPLAQAAINSVKTPGL